MERRGEAFLVAPPTGRSGPPLQYLHRLLFSSPEDAVASTLLAQGGAGACGGSSENRRGRRGAAVAGMSSVRPLPTHLAPALLSSLLPALSSWQPPLLAACNYP